MSVGTSVAMCKGRTTYCSGIQSKQVHCWYLVTVEIQIMEQKMFEGTRDEIKDEFFIEKIARLCCQVQAPIVRSFALSIKKKERKIRSEIESNAVQRKDVSIRRKMF